MFHPPASVPSHAGSPGHLLEVFIMSTIACDIPCPVLDEPAAGSSETAAQAGSRVGDRLTTTMSNASVRRSTRNSADCRKNSAHRALKIVQGMGLRNTGRTAGNPGTKCGAWLLLCGWDRVRLLSGLVAVIATMTTGTKGKRWFSAAPAAFHHPLGFFPTGRPPAQLSRPLMGWYFSPIAV